MTSPDCCCSSYTKLIEVHQVDGALGLLRPTETGEPHFERLDVIKLVVNENRRSAICFRPYVVLRLPPDLALRLGRREITVALYTTAEDRARRYNRTAHVRLIAPGSPSFAIYRRSRGDSESLNRNLEDTLYRNHRAHSKGWRAQPVDMLGFAGLVNALTRANLRRQVATEAA